MSLSAKEVSFIFPKSGNLFYEKRKNKFQFCWPHLMSIRSYTLEKLEKMQIEAQNSMKQKESK